VLPGRTTRQVGFDDKLMALLLWIRQPRGALVFQSYSNAKLDNKQSAPTAWRK